MEAIVYENIIVFSFNFEISKVAASDYTDTITLRNLISFFKACS